jgi:hypothetical protein
MRALAVAPPRAISARGVGLFGDLKIHQGQQAGHDPFLSRDSLDGRQV